VVTTDDARRLFPDVHPAGFREALDRAMAEARGGNSSGDEPGL
jgi:hypothetical protein